jgi:solute:Na+ symporter, SSS family
VIICGYTEAVAYLWLNVVGCLGVVIFALLIQPMFKQKSPAL